MDFGKHADVWPEVSTTFHIHLESEHLFQLILYADIILLQQQPLVLWQKPL